MNLHSIQLTDSPAVVAMKTRFRELDEREEQLKRRPFSDVAALNELTEVRSQKATIAQQVFVGHSREVFA